MRRPNAADTRRYSTAGLVLGLALILLVLVLGAWFYRDQSEHLRSQAQANIDAVGDLMAAEVLEWRTACLAELEVFYAGPLRPLAWTMR